MIKIKYAFLGLGILIMNSVLAQELPSSGHELIREMHNRHSANWYKSFCFSQKVFNYKNDSLISKDVWHEAYKSPGNLIIKFSDWNSGNGMIFSDDSLYFMVNGDVAKKSYRLHDLIVLGLDVNNQLPEVTISQAEKLGYDLTKISKTNINGNSAWVVGDTSKLCFWVDAERLLFVKMRRVSANSFREVEFARYDQIDGMPVATIIKFYNQPGKVEMLEEYFNVRLNCVVSDSIFNPFYFNKARW